MLDANLCGSIVSRALFAADVDDVCGSGVCWLLSGWSLGIGPAVHASVDSARPDWRILRTIWNGGPLLGGDRAADLGRFDGPDEPGFSSESARRAGDCGARAATPNDYELLDFAAGF